VRDSYKGIAAIIVASLLFSIMSVIVKYASQAYGYSGTFLVFFRFLTALVLTLLLLSSGKVKWCIEDKKSWVLRGIFGSISMILFYVAVTLVGSARGMLLNYMYPLFTAFFAPIFFSEKTSKTEAMGILVSFFGVFVIFGLGGGEFDMYGLAAGILSALFAGLSINLVRKLRAEDPVLVYLSPVLFGFIIVSFETGNLALSNEFPQLTSASLVLLGAMGLFAFFAQVIQTWGYKHLKAVRGSSVAFSAIPMVAALSYFLLGESINLQFIIGAFFIFLGIRIVNRSEASY